MTQCEVKLPVCLGKMVVHRQHVREVMTDHQPSIGIGQWVNATFESLRNDWLMEQYLSTR